MPRRLICLVAAALVVAACASDANESSAPTTTSAEADGSSGDAREVDPRSAAAGGGGGTGTRPAADPADGPGDLTWTSCGTSICTTVPVPLDHAAPDGARIDIAVEMAPALDPDRRVGTLFLNPGGPGVPGVGMLPGLDEMLPSEVIDRFDLVTFDPRGIGRSNPIVCTTLEDWLVEAGLADDDDGDGTADVALAEHPLDVILQAAEANGRTCMERAGEIVPTVGSQNVARDMDAIRVALGEEQINYLGWSYGTAIGQQYLALFPGQARAVVLDSVVDSGTPWVQRWIEMAKGREQTLRQVLRECTADPGCALNSAAGGDAEARFDAMLAALADEPMVLPNGARYTSADVLGLLSGRLYAGREGFAEVEGLIGALVTLDPDAVWQYLQESPDLYLEDLDEDPYDGEPADDEPADEEDREPNDEDLEFFDHLLNADQRFSSVICADFPIDVGVDGFRAAVARAQAEAPLFGDLIYAHAACLFLPVGPGMQVAAGPDVPPTLVVNTLYDPATPLVQAQRTASRIDRSVVLTSDSARHIAFPSGTGCLDGPTVTYLVEATLPSSAACGLPANGG